MDRVRLSQSPVGRLVPILAPDPRSGEVVNGEAFLPADLPRDVVLATPTWTAVSRATAALARLDGAARLIPDPRLLRNPALRQEAQSTSALEGTFAPFEEVMAADADASERSPEIREILNFESVAQLAFSWPEDRALTLTLLNELQGNLVRGTPGQLSDAGRLRDRVVVIGARGRGFDEARFVPPPQGDQLRAGVESLLGWIDQPPDVPSVVQAAMTHYQFETLHPYSDGNGRIGRLLVVVQLLRNAVIREPLLVVSPWFEERRDSYQDHLLELSCTGAWDPWVEFFAEGVAAAATESRLKVEALVALGEALRARVQHAGKRGLVERLAGDLIGFPFVSAPAVMSRYDASRQTSLNALKTLSELGILRFAFETSRGSAVHQAPEVMRVLSSR